MKPDPYYRAAGALRTYGKEAAEEVASFEARQVKEIKALVEKEKIDADFVVTRATDVSLYDEIHHELKKGLDELNEAGISTASDVFYSGEKTAEGVSLPWNDRLLALADIVRYLASKAQKVASHILPDTSGHTSWSSICSRRLSLKE